MAIRWRSVLMNLTKSTVAATFCFSLGSAQAVTINFDDLTYVPNPDSPCFCDDPLTDQYQSKGLLIDGGFLVPADPSGNSLLGSNFLQLSFVGTFPTFVSMCVSAPSEDVIYLDAYGVSGFVAHKQTTGWGGPFDDTPYVPKQIVSFSSLSGINSITLQGFYDLRVEALVDDLTFTYASDVPEPAPLLLFSFGFIVIARRYFAR